MTKHDVGDSELVLVDREYRLSFICLCCIGYP
jgi:hypothetical protein